MVLQLLIYVPGKNLVIADTLSRAPLLKPGENDSRLFQEETKAYMCSVIQGLLATKHRLEKIRVSQERDPGPYAGL